MFLKSISDTMHVVTGEYSVIVVVLSIMIANSTVYLALGINQRMQENSLFHKRFWLISSSIIIGLGIWAMHFVGMLAFMLPVEMTYNIPLTMISAIPAIIAAYIAFYISNSTKAKKITYIISGIIMGLGIVTMHYTGMYAMDMEIDYYYKLIPFIITIIDAIIVSFVLLFTMAKIYMKLNTVWRKSVAAISMGIAITSIHYLGMSAVVFYTHIPIEDMQMATNNSLLFLIVTIGIFFIFIVSALTNLLDSIQYFDTLTLLPNQRQFERDFKKDRQVFGMAVIHVHNLEKWLTKYGYKSGDSIIRGVRDLLRQHKMKSMKLYRTEDNRFVLVQYGQNNVKTLENVLRGFLHDMSVPLDIEQHSIPVGVICAYSHGHHHKDFSKLFEECNAVLKHPSTDFKRTMIAYDESIHNNYYERIIVDGIEKAMRENELYLVYQPKVEYKTHRTAGLEALLRWKHPEEGLIPPGVFVPILEREGKITDMTDWVIAEACLQIYKWKKDHVPFGHISINIPGMYVTSPRLINVLVENVEKYNLEKRLIELEVTETSVIDEFNRAIQSLEDMRKLGFLIALDDFGTGFSSLSYLKRLPITTIKIDKSFVDDILESARDADILKLIIKLGSTLNLHVIVEGVETEEQLKIIQSVPITSYIQGYYFSKPLDVDDIPDWLGENNAS